MSLGKKLPIAGALRQLELLSSCCLSARMRFTSLSGLVFLYLPFGFHSHHQLLAYHCLKFKVSQSKGYIGLVSLV